MKPFLKKLLKLTVLSQNYAHKMKVVLEWNSPIQFTGYADDISVQNVRSQAFSFIYLILFLRNIPEQRVYL